MATRAEQYFFEQIAPHSVDASEVIACGYFRTFIRDGWGKKDLSVFADAAKARGHFLALTNDKLLVVKTRAPATSSPLLENKGTFVIPLSAVRKVTLGTDLFLIDSDVETLPLQLQVSNKAFPGQGHLLDEVARKFNLPASVASIRAAQTRKRLMKVGLVATAVVAGLLWAMFKNGN